MRYEFPHFRIDRRDFMKGSNSSEEYPDGGFVYSSHGYNVFSKPGWLANSQDYGLTIDATLPTGIGISFGYGRGTIQQETIAVGNNASQDGSFYTVIESTGAMTKVGSDDTGRDYQTGKTSTIYYKSNFYTTSTTDICKNSIDLATRDTSWWVTTSGETSLDSFAPHPQVIFGDIHYIADGRYIHQNDNGTTTYNVFDLGSDWVITAMAVYSNMIYITAESYYNFGGTYHGIAKVITWNGYADSFIDEWFIDHRISAMYVYKGALYIWSNNNGTDFMGYFTGGIVNELFPISNTVYQHMITTTKDSMWFADGDDLIRYGSPTPRGEKRFHRYNNFTSNINGLFGSYAETIGITMTGVTYGSNFVFKTTDAPGGNKTFIFNRRIFSRPVRIRGYVIHTSTISGYVETSFIDDQNTIRATKKFDATVSEMTGKERWRFDIAGIPPTTSVKPRITLAGAPYVQAIDVLYEASEDKLNA